MLCLCPYCVYIDEDIACTLEDVLVFFSGASCVPPLGFDSNPTLVFLHSKTATLPTASTCDLQLRLPATYNEYHKFKEAMVLGLKGHNGFGGVWTNTFIVVQHAQLYSFGIFFCLVLHNLLYALVLIMCYISLISYLIVLCIPAAVYYVPLLCYWSVT